MLAFCFKAAQSEYRRLWTVFKMRKTTSPPTTVVLSVTKAVRKALKLDN